MTLTEHAPTSSDNTQGFDWFGWISPKISHPRPGFKRRYTRKDRDSPKTAQLPRRASFQERLDSSRDVDSFDSSVYARDGAVNSRRVDKTGPIRVASQTTQPQTAPQFPLLTAFLHHLNDLLPEYCNHLTNASDISQSRDALTAIQNLERGVTASPIPCKRATLPQSRSPILKHPDFFLPSQFSKNTPHSHKLRMGSDYSSSPRRENQHKLGNESTQHSMSPSPNRRQNGVSSAPRSAPSSPQSKSIFSYKAVNITTANEWERFVTPFILLASAEDLYGRMAHVIDPASENNFVAKNSSCNMQDSAELNDSLIKNDNKSNHRRLTFETSCRNCFKGVSVKTTKTSPRHVDKRSPTKSYQKELQLNQKIKSPLRSPCPAFNQGSCRLISIYRQIRQDLVVVGEYLCDPVIGSRVEGFHRYQRDGGASDDVSKETVPMSPDIVAARSLRETLDGLIAFIDARCILVSIHSDICRTVTPTLPLPSTTNQTMDVIKESGRKLSNLEYQYQSTSMLKPLMDIVATDAKILRLALGIVGHMEDFNFFQSVITSRKLCVLLGSCKNNTYLPMTWVKTSYDQMVALMLVVFSDELSTPQMLLSTIEKSLHEHEEKVNISTTCETIDFDALSSEIIAANGHDPALAVLVVRKPQHDDSWLPVYIKSSLETPAPKRRLSKVTFNVYRDASTWPMTLWHQIKCCLERSMDNPTGRANFLVHSKTIDVVSDLLSHTSDISIKNQSSGSLSTCHIALAKSIGIVVIRNTDKHRGKKLRISQDDVSEYLDHAMPKLSSINFLGVDSVLTARVAITNLTATTKQQNQTGELTSLWDASNLTEKRPDNILTFCLRKNSPVISPLKSPYTTRQMGEMGQKRTKHIKNTVNHAHLALFVGTELSQFL